MYISRNLHPGTGSFSDPQRQAEQLPGVDLGEGRGPSGLCWPCWRPLWPSDQCLLCHLFTSRHCLSFQHLNVLASSLRLVCQPRSCLILSNPTALPWFNCQGVHSPSPQPLASPFFPLPQLQLLCFFKVTGSPGERTLLPRPGPSAPLAPLAPAAGFLKRPNTQALGLPGISLMVIKAHRGQAMGAPRVGGCGHS